MNIRIARTVLGLLFLVLNTGFGTAAEAGPTDTGELNRPTVLVFGLGSRCRYCVQLKEEIGRVTAETGDAVRFRDIMVDRDEVLAKQYRVVLSPTLVFLDAAGSEVFRHQGMLNAQQILERLDALRLWPEKG